jgi:hypothetical protein
MNNVLNAPIATTAVDPSRKSESEIARSVRDLALRMLSTEGAANLFMVAGMLSQESEKPVTTEIVRRAIQLVQGFEWLSEQDGWFWFGPDPRNHFVSVATKILAVARQRIDIEDIHGGLTRSRRIREEVRMTADPPMSVLGVLLSRIDGVRKIQHNDFVMEPKPEPREVLSQTELGIYERLSAAGGMADRLHLVKTLVKKRGMTMISLQVALNQSPIFLRLGYGIYGLRGWPLDARSAARAIKAAQRNRSGGSTSVARRSGNCFNFKKVITQPMIENRMFEIPATIGRACADGDYRFNGSGEYVVRINRSSSGSTRASGIYPILKKLGVSPGMKISVSIDTEKRIVDFKLVPQSEPIAT